MCRDQRSTLGTHLRFFRASQSFSLVLTILSYSVLSWLTRESPSVSLPLHPPPPPPRTPALGSASPLSLPLKCDLFHVEITFLLSKSHPYYCIYIHKLGFFNLWGAVDKLYLHLFEKTSVSYVYFAKYWAANITKLIKELKFSQNWPVIQDRLKFTDSLDKSMFVCCNFIACQNSW